MAKFTERNFKPGETIFGGGRGVIAVGAPPGNRFAEQASPDEIQEEAFARSNLAIFKKAPDRSLDREEDGDQPDR